VIDRLFSGSGFDPAKPEGPYEKGELRGFEMTLRLDVTEERIFSPNIVGLIEGTDDVRHGRTMAFNVLVLYQLVDAVCVRSDEVSAFVRPFDNRWLWASLAAALLLQMAVLYVPSLQEGFGTVGLSLRDWGVCFGVAASVLVARELLKAIFRARDRRA
jgi:magnesium-transporting ATPase (P-type)